MSKEWNPDTIFDIFASETARNILALASMKPMSADELAQYCDTSKPTIYRRINVLLDHDFLTANDKNDRDGIQYRTFTTNLHRISFEINDGGIDTDLQLRHDLVDQFDGLWTDLQRETDTSDE
ncbi:ArsR/SmtB family transcription factor [Halocatena marina]|uniref:ArsR/SmtB family transcription factor n=1 Tax=Halocatena marina TaxID=2934937 RepID=UPI00200C66C4|nr:helix-turn-helix domain-containing protein [Halocatena marina]